jgi:5-methylcytosine-specific restriction protein A
VQKILELIFRQITPADFFNINKLPGTEDGGGGQSYIDVPVNNVTLDDWYKFLGKYTPDTTKSGPVWHVQIESLGGLGSQTVDIGLRRAASVNIRSQKLFSRSSNRIYAWHPDHGGFPRAPVGMVSAEDPRVIELAAGVRVFIAKTDLGDYWAGWLKTEEIEKISATDSRFEPMLTEPAGYLVFDPTIELDTTNLKNPFALQGVESQIKPSSSTVAAEDPQSSVPKRRAPYNAKSGRTEEDIAVDLFQDDSSSEEVKKSQKVIETFERNRKAVRDLKKLYKKCQITGDSFTFSKSNGEPYLEVHHLIPLGEGGSDRPANLVVVSAHIHRMLHFASVEGIDLSKIEDGKLHIKINTHDYVISWHPDHAKLVTSRSISIV